MQSEAQEHKAFVAWFKARYKGVDIMLIRNDGKRTAIEKKEQIRMGLCKGASDLYIPDWHTWIEMKKLDGKESEDQISFGERRIKAGDRYCACQGAKEAINYILSIEDETNMANANATTCKSLVITKQHSEVSLKWKNNKQ